MFDSRLFMGWDWAMIEALMARGTRWLHADRPSFIFRLAKYPEIIARPAETPGYTYSVPTIT